MKKWRSYEELKAICEHMGTQVSSSHAYCRSETCPHGINIEPAEYGGNIRFCDIDLAYKASQRGEDR